MARKDDFKVQNQDSPWLIVAGCTLAGLGIGMAANEAAAGTIIGAGIGLLAMYFFTKLIF